MYKRQEQDGPEKFKEIENQVNADIHVTDTVIAPGGSVIYCDEAMEHLKSCLLYTSRCV